MATVRPGTKSAFAIAVMEKLADKPMDKVIPKIAEAAGLSAEKARHYYVLFVRKGLAPGVVPPRARAEGALTARVSNKAKATKAVNVERLKAALAKKKGTAKKAKPKKAAAPKEENSTTAA